MNRFSTHLRMLRDAHGQCPCETAVAWAETQPDFASAWVACERGDWLAWLLDCLDAWPEGARSEYVRTSDRGWAARDFAIKLSFAMYELSADSVYASVRECARAEYERARRDANDECYRAIAEAVRVLVPLCPIPMGWEDES